MNTCGNIIAYIINYYIIQSHRLQLNIKDKRIKKLEKRLEKRYSSYDNLAKETLAVIDKIQSIKI